jgi:2-iminobutanoate/2-iminopropanoate deaminase
MNPHRSVLKTPEAPVLDVPLSQAVRFGNLLFVSGQVPIDPGTGEFVGGSVELQTRQVLDNVRSILEAAGTSLADVLKVTVFLVDIKDFGAFNAIYREYFPSEPPARSTFQVGLAGPFALEIEAIAAVA